MWVLRHRMSQCWYRAPGFGNAGHEIVVGGVGEECSVAMAVGVVAAVGDEVVFVGL